jgi:putative oxidoreductase
VSNRPVSNHLHKVWTQGKKARTGEHGGAPLCDRIMAAPFTHRTPLMRQMIADTASRLLDFLYKIRWLGPLVARLSFGYFWLETGIAKVQNLDGFTQRFMGWGVPFPAFSAGLSAWTELVGGALIMLGLFTRLINIPMIINMIVAIVLVVSANFQGIDEFVEADETVYILIFFWLLMAGPGKVSLDTLLARWLGIRTKE